MFGKLAKLAANAAGAAGGVVDKVAHRHRHPSSAPSPDATPSTPLRVDVDATTDWAASLGDTHSLSEPQTRHAGLAMLSPGEDGFDVIEMDDVPDPSEATNRGRRAGMLLRSTLVRAGDRVLAAARHLTNSDLGDMSTLLSSVGVGVDEDGLPSIDDTVWHDHMTYDLFLQEPYSGARLAAATPGSGITPIPSNGTMHARAHLRRLRHTILTALAHLPTLPAPFPPTLLTHPLEHAVTTIDSILAAGGVSQYPEMAQAVATAIQHLAVGSSLVVPCGWATRLVLLVVTRTHPQTLSVCVCNTLVSSDPALGIPYHERRIDPDTGRAQGMPLLRITNVALDRMTSLAFWIVLFRPLVAPAAKHPLAQDGPATVLYERILPLLDGTPVHTSHAAAEADALWMDVLTASGDVSYSLALAAAIQQTAAACARACAIQGPLAGVLRRTRLLPVAVMEGMARATAVALGSLDAVAEASHARDAFALTMMARELARAWAAVLVAADAIPGADALPILAPDAIPVETTVDALSVSATLVRRFHADERIAMVYLCPAAAAPAPRPPPAAAHDLEMGVQLAVHGHLRQAGLARDALAGGAPPPTILRPVDLAGVFASAAPPSTGDWATLVHTLRVCLDACVLLASQADDIRHSAAMRVALVEHLFTAWVPLPLPLYQGNAGRCWYGARAGSLTRSQQTDIACVLDLIARHYTAAALSLPGTREADAARITTMGCVMIVLDRVLRLRACDRPSHFCAHYAGTAPGPTAPFRYHPGHYEAESQTMQFTDPDLAVARGAILAYHGALCDTIPDTHVILTFTDLREASPGDAALLSQLALALAFPTQGEGTLERYLTGEDVAIVDHYPEYRVLRDVTFLYRMLMVQHAGDLPATQPWSFQDAALSWVWEPAVGFSVVGFDRPLVCRGGFGQAMARAAARGIHQLPTGIASLFKKPLAYIQETPVPEPRVAPSHALPSVLCRAPDDTPLSEADILHLRALPTFSESISEQESELLLSYLTEPYLRIPLVLSFFADESRVFALADPGIQGVLDAALFEPGQWLRTAFRARPATIPLQQDPDATSTPLGLLFNELQCSPEPIVDALVRLACLVSNLDTGRYVPSSSPILLYVVRVLVRVLSHITMLLDHARWRHTSPASGGAPAHAAFHRGLAIAEDLAPATLPALERGAAAIARLLRRRLYRIMERWRVACVTQPEPQIAQACQIIAHQAFLCRTAQAMDAPHVMVLLAAQLFLASNYTFTFGDTAAAHLGVSDRDLFALFERHRARILEWCAVSGTALVSATLEGVVAVLTHDGALPEDLVRVPPAPTTPPARIWRQGGTGRFFPEAELRLAADRLDETPLEGETYPAWLARVTSDVGTEINIQLGTFSMRNQEMQVLPGALATHPDFVAVHGDAAVGDRRIQCLERSHTEHRRVVRLVRSPLDVEHWQPDTRRIEPPEAVRGAGVPLNADAVPWGAAALDGLRHACPSLMGIAWRVDPRIHAAHGDRVCVAYGRHKGTLKMLVLRRRPRATAGVLCSADHAARAAVAHVYDVVEHGRRFFRTQVWSSDARWSWHDAHAAPVDLGGVTALAAGTALAGTRPAASVVVVRHAHPGVVQTHIPARFLHGLLPDALIERYRFWQLANTDALVGTDVSGHPQHAIHVEVVELGAPDRSGGCNALGAAIVRRFDVDATPHLVTDVDRTPPLCLPHRVLLDPWAPALASVSHALAAIESHAQILMWSDVRRAPDDPLRLGRIELPRLGLTFDARTDDDGTRRLCSVDHAGLYWYDGLRLPMEMNPAAVRTLFGISNALVLRSDSHQFFALVSATTRPSRAQVNPADPFQSAQVMEPASGRWVSGLLGSGADDFVPTYLYGIHVSQGFLMPASLTASIYLLLLLLLDEQYPLAFRLVDECVADGRFTSGERAMLTHLMAELAKRTHPDAIACRLALTLALAQAQMGMAPDATNTHMPDGSPDPPQRGAHAGDRQQVTYVSTPWHLEVEMERYACVLPHVSMACRLTPRDERDLFRMCHPSTIGASWVLRNRVHILEAYAQHLAASTHTPAAAHTPAPPTRCVFTLPEVGDTVVDQMATAVGATTAQRRDLTGAAAASVQLFRVPDASARNPPAQAAALGDLPHTEYRRPCPAYTVPSHADGAGADTGAGADAGADGAPPALSSRPMTQVELAQCVDAILQRGSTTAPHELFALTYELVTGTLAVEGASRAEGVEAARVLMATAMTWDGHASWVMSAMRMLFHNGRRIAQLGTMPDLRALLVEVDACVARHQQAQREAQAAQASSLFGRAKAFIGFGETAAARAPTEPLYEAFLARVSAALREIPSQELHWGTRFGIAPNAGGEQYLGVDLTTRASLHRLALFAPRLARYDCRRRALNPATMEDPVMRGLCHTPLASVMRLDRWVKRVPTHETPLHDLPFDPAAQLPAAEYGVPVARRVVDRLGVSVREYTEISAEADGEPVLACLCDLADALRRGDAAPRDWAQAQAQLTELRAAVLAAMEAERRRGEGLIRAACGLARSTGSQGGLAAAAHRLRQQCGADHRPWFEWLVEMTMCADADVFLVSVNPFLTPHDAANTINLTMIAMLVVNRVGVCGRALALADASLRMVRRFATAAAAATATTAVRPADLQRVWLDARRIGACLAVQRHYVSGQALDPRMLVFEFLNNLVLRGAQVRLLGTFGEALAAGGSLCHQMIMGAGKTTVIAPMLALQQASPEKLVVQVVPAPLLEFSRSVMRRAFVGGVVRKPVYTFHFARGMRVTRGVWESMAHARMRKAVVVTTPTALKSFMLKFVELRHLLFRVDELAVVAAQGVAQQELVNGLFALLAGGNTVDSALIESADLAAISRELGQQARWCIALSRLFADSLLMLDEVDLILHPLKSELNWPMDAKQPLDFTEDGLRWLVPMHLLDAVFAARTGQVPPRYRESRRATDLIARLHEVFQEGDASCRLQSTPHLVLLDKRFYAEQVKPLLMPWMMLWLNDKGFKERGVHAELMHRYLGERDTAPEVVSEVRARMADHPELAKMLNLCFEWLEYLLPHVLAKIDRVSFGLLQPDDLVRIAALSGDQQTHNKTHLRRHLGEGLPKSRRFLAVPFVGKDVPSRSNEFSHPEVVIGLSVLAYRYEGLRRSDFLKLVVLMRTRMAHETGAHALRPTCREWARWVRAQGRRVRGEETSHEPHADDGDRDWEDRLWPLYRLDIGNPEQMEAMYGVLRCSRQAIHWYLCQWVFPETMVFQPLKISASGQELGGGMMFGQRVGFSGTPSALLPVAFGECQYQRGDDGRVVNVLSRPDVVNVRLATGPTASPPAAGAGAGAGAGAAPGEADAAWSVHGLLDDVGVLSRQRVGGCNALIDCGALITGMSNLEVARYLLLRPGIQGVDGGPMEGVVFLDVYDRKMVVVRASNASESRVVALEHCGIPCERLFTFYDQVHTTGMDIKQAPSAHAVLTLGKDMVFRDYAQAAFRMRGLGKGQSLSVLCIPEVRRLVGQHAAAPRTARPSSGDTMLGDILAWLCANSMRSELLQASLLCEQSLMNAWRETAHATLRRAFEAESAVTDRQRHTEALAMDLFRQDVDPAVSAEIPEARSFADKAAMLAAEYGELVGDAQAHDLAIDAVMAQASQVWASPSQMWAADGARRPTRELEAVQVQQQEQEQEQEVTVLAEVIVEQVKQREVESTTYQERDYSRANEGAEAWRAIALGVAPTDGAGSDADDAQLQALLAAPPPFHPMHAFALDATAPHIAFPEMMLFSSNFYRPEWAGTQRRVRNVIVVMEWVPEDRHLRAVTDNAACPPAIDLHAPGAHAHLEQAYRLLAARGDLGMTHAEQEGLLRALDVDVEGEQRAGLLPSLHAALDADGDDRVNMRDLARALQTQACYRHQSGRWYVALSLREAAALRALLHTSRQYEAPGTSASLDTGFFALHLAGSGVLLERSEGFIAGPPTQTRMAMQAFRFFDCALDFAAGDANMALRGLQRSLPEERRAFFEATRAVRRRSRAPLAQRTVFPVVSLRDELPVLVERALVARIAAEIAARGWGVVDAFQELDRDGDGVLSEAEVRQGVAGVLGVFLGDDGMDLLMRVLDLDRDGVVCKAEWCGVLLPAPHNHP